MWPIQYPVGFFPLLFGCWFHVQVSDSSICRGSSISGWKTHQESSKISPCVYLWSEEQEGRRTSNPCAKGFPPKAFLVLLVLTDLGIPAPHIHILHSTPTFQYRAVNHTGDSVSRFLPGTSSKALEPGLRLWSCCSLVSDLGKSSHSLDHPITACTVWLQEPSSSHPNAWRHYASSLFPHRCPTVAGLSAYHLLLISHGPQQERRHLSACPC